MNINEQELVSCFEEIEAISQSYITLKANYENLERLKTYNYELLAQGVEANTEAERKRLTVTSPAWRQHIYELNDAFAKYTAIRARWDILNLKWETLRSMLSYQKKADNRSM